MNTTATTTTSPAPTTSTTTTTTTTTTTYAPPTVYTTTSAAAAVASTAAPEYYAEQEFTFETTTVPAAEDPSGGATERQQDSPAADWRTADEQPSDADGDRPDGQQTERATDVPQPYVTTALPTLIQMHNQQQNEQQRLERDGPHGHRGKHGHHGPTDGDQQRNDAYAFESLEKAFATAVPHKIRSTKDLEQPAAAAAAATVGDQLPWSWAKDIMLQKPVLKKSSQEVA